jgi:hypothetical protein
LVLRDCYVAEQTLTPEGDLAQVKGAKPSLSDKNYAARNARRLHRFRRRSGTASTQFPSNLELFWTECAAKRLRQPSHSALARCLITQHAGYNFGFVTSRVTRQLFHGSRQVGQHLLHWSLMRSMELTKFL